MVDASREQIIDAWAQPVLKDGFLPEVVRLFQQSGSAHLLDQDLSAEQLLQLMDKAGVNRVMLSAWHRPGRWVVSNDTIARFNAHTFFAVTLDFLSFRSYVGQLIFTSVASAKAKSAIYIRFPG